MPTRTRFAPSPTGSLHVGNALTAAINRREGDVLVLRIDDTDAARNVEGADDGIARDLEWLGIEWDEGPFRQSARQARYAEVAALLLEGGSAWRDDDGAVRASGGDRRTLVRADGGATYLLASAVDDADYGITHVIRGKDLEPTTELQSRIVEALGAPVPEFTHHGLILGDDGHKLAKRAPFASIADLRDRGIPGEAVRAYLDELGIPRGDVHYDTRRLKRLAIDAIEAMADDDLARHAGAPVEAVPALRGARDLHEARDIALSLAEPEPVTLDADARPTLERLRELLQANGLEPRALVRELQAVGGDLKVVRLALTGRAQGPSLSTVIAALSRDEALRRVDAAL